MNSQQWQQIEALFARAIKLDPRQRQELLDQQAVDDPELCREVAALLAADEAPEDPLAATVRDAAAELTGSERHSWVGRRVGAWRVRQRLGVGGMSSVYLAVRDDDQFRKRAALKVVKHGMDSDAILRRFDLERHILASLEHPNIARLLDAGSTEEGLPYFLMEYVYGLPIDRFCDEHRLSVQERLELFLPVCAAVSYAHQNLIVHRDLKPTNILVTPDGIPKLLDFGIAKLLNPELAAENLDLTGVTLQPMTPGYASPEQLAGAPVTTASDIYSLGVLLTLMLTGRRPYRLDSQPADFERLVRETQADSPSATLARPPSEQLGEPSVEEIAELRRSQPSALLRSLRGDIDAIAETALRQEPQRRYPSVDRLSEDLRRFLDGRPVSVRGNDFTYRAGRFLRRHRWPIASAALAALVLIASLIALVVQSQRLASERDISNRQRLRAERVSSFLIDLFQVTDPSQAQGTTVTARELLDRGAMGLSEDLHDEPAVQATLLQTVGQVYQQLGLYDSAEPLLERSLSLRRQSLGAEHETVADSLNRLAILQVSRGYYDRAVPLFRETLELRQRRFGPEHELIAASLNNLALAYHDLGELAEAEQLYRQAMAMDQALFGRDHPATVTDAANLGLLLHDLGRDSEAEQLLVHVVRIREGELGRRHPDVAEALTFLGMAVVGQGRHGEAETIHRRALDIHRDVLGNQHPELARSLRALAETLLASGRHEAAETLEREALELRRGQLGEHHPEVASSLAGLAATVADVRPAQAEQLYRQAYELQRRTLRPGHLETAATTVGLGRLLLTRGAAAEAEPLLAEALAIYRRYLPENDRRRESLSADLERCRRQSRP